MRLAWCGPFAEQPQAVECDKQRDAHVGGDRDDERDVPQRRKDDKNGLGCQRDRDVLAHDLQRALAEGDGVGQALELSALLQEREISLVILDQGIDTSMPVGRMFFQILGAIAEFEGAMASERTRDGLDAARARGRTGGQKPKLTPRQARIAQDMYNELGPDGKRAHTVQRIAEEFGVSRPTIYRHLQRASASG